MIAQKCGNYKIHVSISHSLDNAIAYATMEVDKFEDCNIRNNEADR